MADGAVPVFDLASPTEVPAPDEGPGDRSTATVVGVVLGVVALLVGLSIISDVGSDAPGDESAASTTTAPPVTTRPSPSRPSTTIGPLVDGEVLLDPDPGLALVAFRGSGRVVVADLATGDQQVIEQEALRSVQVVRWVGGTFVAMGQDGGILHLATDGTGAWEELSIPEGRLELAWGSAANLFWAPGREGFQPARMVLLGDDGDLTELSGPEGFDLWSMEIVGQVGDHLVFNSYDGIFALGSDRQLRRVGFGRVMGVGGPYVVRRVCDDRFACRVVRDELVDGTFAPGRQIELPFDATTSDAQWAYPSPDGRSVAALSTGGMEAVLQVVPVDREGTSTLDGATFDRLALDDPTRLAWVGGGQALVWWNESRRTVNVVSRDEGGSFEMATIATSMGPSPNPYLVHLVPLAELPPGWAPSRPSG